MLMRVGQPFFSPSLDKQNEGVAICNNYSGLNATCKLQAIDFLE